MKKADIPNPSESLSKDFVLDRRNIGCPYHHYNKTEVHMARQFTVVIERDEEGYYVADVPELKGCHTQARSLDELLERAKESIQLCLETYGEDLPAMEFIGIQKVAV